MQVMPQDRSNPDARCQQLSKAKVWLRSIFGSSQNGAEWNTPKKFRTETPTAESGKKAGHKRKHEFDKCDTVASKYHIKALTYH